MNARKQYLPQKSTDQLLAELLALDPENATGRALTQSQTKLTENQRTVVLVLRDAASKRQAQALLDNPDIRTLLCPALIRVSDDVFELSKAITPVLVGLVAAGTVTIPLVPVLFASVALLLSRMGVARVCVGYEQRAAE